MEEEILLDDENILETAKRKGWHYVGLYVILSEKFMNKHWNNLDHYTISYSQTLSEEFIEKHMEDLDIKWISASQVLSEKFIEKYWNLLDHECVFSIIKIFLKIL